MKICVLGNSHAASLKLGWDLISDKYKNYQLTFFASRGDLLSGLKREGNRLIPAEGVPRLKADIEYTSDGLSCVDLSVYDVYITYGLNFQIPLLDSRLSSSVINQTLLDVYLSSLNFYVINLIREGSPSPIYVGHNPQRCNIKKQNQIKNVVTYSKTVECISQLIDVPNVHVVQQPRDTFSNEWNTKKEYSIGSRRLDVGDRLSNELHPENDNGHMNEYFGSLWLTSFFEQLHKK